MFSKKQIIVLTILSMCFYGTKTIASVDEPNLPADFPELIINQYGETSPGYVIGSLKSKNPEVGSYFMILENDGTPVFYDGGLGELTCNGLFTRKKEIPGLRKQFTHHLYDEDGNEVDVYQMGNGYLADDHDFQVLPNGHVLMLSYSPHIIDMSQIVEGGHPACEVTGAVIQELDVYKNVIFQWRSIDHIAITDSFKELTGARVGYIHVNSVELDETDGSLVLSCRNTYDLIKISRVTGEVIWRLCGKQNDFAFINEHEENAPLYIRGTHDARVHANGNITMFDNGAYEDDMVRTYSRAVEYDINDVNMTATMVWEYRNVPDFLALSGGDCIRMANGNTTINWGAAAKEGQAPAMSEVDPNGQLVYEIWPAQENVEGRFVRFIWPLEDQSTIISKYELMEGNEYVFANNITQTGISLRVLTLDGERYNHISVTREPFAPLYPEFPGKAPRILQVRVIITPWEIYSMTANMSFDAESFGFDDRSGEFGYVDPNMLTIYYRPFEEQGLFIPLDTYYNPITKQLKATMIGFGEFIIGFPDIEEVPYVPLLVEPAEGAMVNQDLDLELFWTPQGFGRSYCLQVAKDDAFTDIVVDDPTLMETRYTLDSIDPNTTYYWRVNTTNYGGTSQWSQSSFQTVSPMINVTAPNGIEQWQSGLEYFIKWQDNLDEDVVIELYKGGTFIEEIDTASSSGAYLWEVGLELESGDDYQIKIKSTVDQTISDISDNYFTIMN